MVNDVSPFAQFIGCFDVFCYEEHCISQFIVNVYLFVYNYVLTTGLWIL